MNDLLEELFVAKM